MEKEQPSEKEEYTKLRSKFRRSQTEWDKLIGQDVLIARVDGEVPKAATILDVSDKGRVKIRYYQQEAWEELDFNDIVATTGTANYPQFSMVEEAHAPSTELEVWPTKEFNKLRTLKQLVESGYST